MSTSNVVRVIKWSIVALVALTMPRAVSRSQARAKVNATSPVDGQSDDAAKPKAPL